MSQITIVLPFALPAPEFATELTRSLQAPALAALLSRTSSHQHHPYKHAARALPHEVWLARALGLEEHGQPGFAAAAMRGFGLDPGEGSWFIVNPAHIDIARSHLMMPDLRHLALSEEGSRALFDAALPWFEEAGHQLRYGDAQTWFMRADDWAGMDTASPDAAVGMNLTDFMPTGAHALAFRKLQNEIQMLWYTHPANASRESRRLPSVNAFWLWSGASAHDNTGAPGVATSRADCASVATFETPGWLTALGHALPSLNALTNELNRDTLLVCGNVAAPAIAADWAGWLHQMQRLETELFAPLLAALMQGRVKQATLVLGNRDAHAEFTTTALAQRKFWRRPSLERLT
jgi:hypothetical protein